MRVVAHLDGRPWPRPGPAKQRRAAVLFAALVVALGVQRAQAQPVATAPDVRSVRIDGPITAVTADYIDRAVGAAEEARVDAFLIEMDTPGGDTTSLQRIASRLLNAEVPTVVWVGPQGAQAASAGTFVLLAAHASGMAPNTVVGAASPVGSGGEDLPETVGRKITEDMAASARSIAGRRGDAAADWAERAVREAVSATADEALELGIIDAVAASPEELLSAVDGLWVEVAGAQSTLDTDGAVIVPTEMSAGERLLSGLAHPAVALLLLTLGINAILIELSSPGGFVAGVVGVLCLVLGFYSLGVLGANLVGLVFMVVAFALLVLELANPSGGVLTLAGLVLFAVGAVVLFQGGTYGVPWLTIATLTVGIGAFFVFVVAAAFRARRRRPATGDAALVGQRAVVRRTLEPRGHVLVHGELWDAVLEGGEVAPPGTEVLVSGRDGLTLTVRRA